MELFKIEIEKAEDQACSSGGCACACVPGVGGGTGQV